MFGVTQEQQLQPTTQAPTTTEEEALKRNTDCVYFLASPLTCKKAKFGGKEVSGTVISDLKSVGKKSMEWDLNDWKWDGDLFRAAQLNSAPSDCRSRQLFPSGSEIPTSTGLSNSSSSGSDGITLGNERGKGELEKRRRVVVIKDEVLNNEAGSLNLKLGGQVYPITEEEEENWVEKSGKKTKLVGVASNRAVCQVEGCRVDLSNPKRLSLAS